MFFDNWKRFRFWKRCPLPLLDEKVILMTERVTPRRHGSYGIDAPYAPAFIAVMTAVVLGMAILSGHWQTFVPITFMLAVLGSTFTARFAASSWFGPSSSTSCIFGVMNEFWTWDAAG